MPAPHCDAGPLVDIGNAPEGSGGGTRAGGQGRVSGTLNLYASYPSLDRAAVAGHRVHILRWETGQVDTRVRPVRAVGHLAITLLVVLPSSECRLCPTQRGTCHLTGARVQMDRMYRMYLPLSRL